MVELSKPLAGLIAATLTAAISGLVLASVAKLLDPTREHGITESKRKLLEKKLGRALPYLNVYEEIIAGDVVDSDSIKVKFDSIGGLDNVKQELHDTIVLPLQRPELFMGNLLKPQKGVLLYGPPGTGKTMLAKALAKESGAVFINVRLSSLMSKWFGDGQKLVTATFSLANKLQPAIIFVDEVDSFLGSRGRSNESEAMASMKTEFMVAWDGFATTENSRVMVLCATNRPWDLDDAILRRTSRSFEIPLPDAAGRASILRKLLRYEHVDPGLDVAAVARQSNGLSGADLAEVARQAALIPVKEFILEERRLMEDDLSEEVVLEKRPLKQQDFERVLSAFTPSKSAAEEYRKRNGHGSRSGSASGVASGAESTLNVDFLRLLALLNSGMAARGP